MRFAYAVRTLEGEIRADIDDWIITTNPAQRAAGDAA